MIGGDWIIRCHGLFFFIFSWGWTAWRVTNMAVCACVCVSILNWTLKFWNGHNYNQFPPIVMEATTCMSTGNGQSVIKVIVCHFIYLLWVVSYSLAWSSYHMIVPSSYHKHEFRGNARFSVCTKLYLGPCTVLGERVVYGKSTRYQANRHPRCLYTCTSH